MGFLFLINVKIPIVKDFLPVMFASTFDDVQSVISKDFRVHVSVTLKSSKNPAKRLSKILGGKNSHQILEDLLASLQRSWKDTVAYCP